MAPPNPLELAAEGVRTLQAFGRRIPVGGGVLAPSLKDRINGRVVLITGASSGIGRAAALKVGEAGAIVLLVARTKSKLDELAQEIEAAGGTGYSHPCDLSGPGPARGRRRAGQQRRQVDPPLGGSGLSPLS
jgi:hypothetical protein